MSYPPSEQLTKRAIVLVHGAWVGEWSWLPVREDLLASGRPVHAVSLTGHGAKRHQSGPHVTLSDHVADVVGLVETLDLVDITLVGHSYGGRVITKAFAALADRIEGMVYVDAHAPLADPMPQPPGRVVEGGMIPFQGYGPDPALVGGEAGVEWFNQRVMPQSAACLSESWHTPLPDDVPKTYLYASDGAAADGSPSRFESYAAAAKENEAWQYEELPGPHFVMLSHPKEVAQIILAR